MWASRTKSAALRAAGGGCGRQPQDTHDDLAVARCRCAPVVRGSCAALALCSASSARLFAGRGAVARSRFPFCPLPVLSISILQIIFLVSCFTFLFGACCDAFRVPGTEWARREVPFSWRRRMRTKRARALDG
ncbi:hypothetical protein B0H17DRAFT_338995 [Mycena rosella]|uniref:Uncharacterized protein n=1 Tax=Mycena rosella TaxID=1033263 RepID=A0AAD7CR50_MYCRO|nr:hypothetical protein B0H17DRAFT_338995 [Mycena rosella]